MNWLQYVLIYLLIGFAIYAAKTRAAVDEIMRKNPEYSKTLVFLVVLWICVVAAPFWPLEFFKKE